MTNMEIRRFKDGDEAGISRLIRVPCWRSTKKMLRMRGNICTAATALRG